MKKMRTLKIGRYIALLLVMVIAIIYVNVWFYISFRKQAEKVNNYVQDQLIARISEYYKETNALVFGIVSENDIVALQKISDKNEVYRSEIALDIVKKLRANNRKSSIIENVYVYIDELDLVLCESGIVEPETFYDIIGKKYFKSYEDWMQTIRIQNQKKNFYTNDESIMFSFLLNNINKYPNNRNIVIGSFTGKENVFVKTPHIDWVNQSNVYVYNRKGELSLCEENVNIETLPQNPDYAELMNISSGYNVLSYEVTINDSSYHILVVFEKNLNMQNVKKVQAVSIATIVIFFLFASYYIYNLYQKKYKPLKAISKLLDINVDKIDYTLIEKPIKNIVEKSQMLNKMLEKNNTNLKLIVLKRLLTGDLSKEFMNDLESLGVKLDKEGCFVTALHLYTDSDITEDENSGLITAIEDEINAILEENGVAYFVLENHYLICICNTEKDFDLDKFGASVLDVVKELENKYNFVASIAISKMHTKYWHISKAYAEAMETISNSELYDKSKVVFYSDVIDNECSHKFSLDDENKLMEAIKCSNAGAAEAIINNIIKRIDPENTFLYMNVSVGLVYSLIRIANLLFGENFDTRSVVYLVKNTDDLKVLSNACIEFATKMCEASKNTQSENKIAGKVMEYIQNNYGNSQLTAKVIVDEMGYSFVYLNNLFKQEYSSTIVAYLNYYRIEKAKELIEKDVPVNETAKSVGILSIRTFNRQFQNITGMTPTDYKKSITANTEKQV